MALTKEECVIAWNCIKGLESYPIECSTNETQDKFKTIPFDELFGNEIALIDKLIKEHFDNPLLELGWIKDEKSTPKELAYEGDDCDENGVIYDTAICPSCDKHFEIDYDEHAKYCPDCGQALNWSEIDG